MDANQLADLNLSLEMEYARFIDEQYKREKRRIIMDTPDQVRKFYQSQLAEYGPSARGMAWGSTETHLRRLNLAKQISGYVNRSKYQQGMTVLDVGCGLCWLPFRWGMNLKYDGYTGVDLVPEYLADVRARFGHLEDDRDISQMNLLEGDFLDMPGPWPAYDITVALGTMAWQPAVTATAIYTKMWELTRRTMVISVLLNRPFSKLYLLNIAKELGAEQFCYWEEYVPNEVMMAFYRHVGELNG